MGSYDHIPGGQRPSRTQYLVSWKCDGATAQMNHGEEGVDVAEAIRPVD